MALKLVLYISDYQLTAYHFAAGKIASTMSFEANAQGHAAFAEWLQKAPSTPTALLVDSIREEYHLNTIPHVMGSDRRAMLERRTIRLFSGAQYTYAWVQGKQPNSAAQGRVDDRVLFMALPESDALLRPWLQHLLDAQVPVIGIYSLPLFSQTLLRAAAATSSHVLLVGNTPEINDYSTSGLRQSFFVDNQLFVSRLTAMSSLQPEQYIKDATREIQNTQQYLYAAGQAKANESDIEVIWLLSGKLLETCRAQLADKPPLGLSYHFIDIQQFAKKHGLSSLEALNRELLLCDIACHALTRRTPANHYARQEDRKYYSYLQQRRNISSVGIMMLLGAATIAGINLNDALDLQKQASSLENKTRLTEQAHARIQQEQRDLLGISGNVDVKTIKSTVDASQYLNANHAEPRQAFTRLGLALQGAPGLQLDGIRWHLEERSKTFLKPVTAKEANQPAGSSRFAMAAASLRQRSTSAPQDLVELIELEGQMQPDALGDYKKTEAWRILNEFVARLQQQPHVLGADIIESPVNLDGSAAMSSTRDNANQLKFRLSVALTPSFIGVVSE